MTDPQTRPPLLAVMPRDARLDFLRGVALVMIFINHVPGTVYENFTSRNFGFSDAAEGFVLISGIAAGLAYSPAIARGITWPSVGRIWHRAWTLYLIHLLTTVLAIAVVAAGVLWLDTAALLKEHNLGPIFTRPFGVQMGIPLLSHQIGYANILPLYAVLLMVTPFALVAALNWPRALIAGAAVLWFRSGHFYIDFPNFPNAGGWFFNPLSWQLLFAIGLATGAALRRGQRLVPDRLWARWATGLFLLVAAVCTLNPTAQAAMGTMLWRLQDAGMPRIITAFDKTYVSVPRLLHILALTYVLSALPLVKRASAHRLAQPFALLGRQALPVFALGSVLCIGAQGIMFATGQGFGMDLALVGGGLAAQWALAAARHYWPRDPRPA